MDEFKFDPSGLLIFLGFVVPGVLAQKARDVITPRSLKPSSAVAELADYVLDSVYVHSILSLTFLAVLRVWWGNYLVELGRDFAANPTGDFLWRHPRMTLSYFVLCFPLGYAFGCFRGWQTLVAPIRDRLLDLRLPRWALERLGIRSFLKEQPVWYTVFSEKGSLHNTFVEVEMKENKGFYTGLLKAYGILDDSERSKDFYLIVPYFRPDSNSAYASLNCDGVLLNFSDVTSIRVKKQAFPPPSSEPGHVPGKLEAKETQLPDVKKPEGSG